MLKLTLGNKYQLIQQSTCSTCSNEAAWKPYIVQGIIEAREMVLKIRIRKTTVLSPVYSN